MEYTKAIFLEKTLLFLFTSYSLIGIGNYLFEQKEVVHEITILHPGMKEEKDCRLIEEQDKQGNSVAYNMDVQSVICLDGQCKIVDVRLHWDRLGTYTKYELAKGVELEKKDGLPFVEKDYEKLQAILLDKSSIFKDFELGEVVDVKKDDGGIDGISGATILTDESASVKGAAWTCYTLWHWANGTIQDTIQHITAKNTSEQVLFTFLTEEDKRFNNFALSQFHQRKIYEQSVIQTIIEQAKHFEPATTKLLLQYLKDAPPTLFYITLQQLFQLGNKQQQRRCNL